MKNLLKGNYKVKTKVVEKKGKKSQDSNYKKEALNSVGGSMVFVERDKLFWDGDDE